MANILNTENETRECFTPFDDYSRLQFRALKAISDLKSMGLITYRTFYKEVCDVLPEMKLHENQKRLSAFWYLRNFDEAFIEKMEVLVDNFKEE